MCVPRAFSQYTEYVDPMIGSGAHGHVFVGANVPWGMVNVGPVQPYHGWDWCSGYHETGDSIIGFAHTHLSGTGIGDLFDITVMPVVGGGLTYARAREEDLQVPVRTLSTPLLPVTATSTRWWNLDIIA